MSARLTQQARGLNRILDVQDETRQSTSGTADMTAPDISLDAQRKRLLDRFSEMSLFTLSSLYEALLGAALILDATMERPNCRGDGGDFLEEERDRARLIAHYVAIAASRKLPVDMNEDEERRHILYIDEFHHGFHAARYGNSSPAPYDNGFAEGAA